MARVELQEVKKVYAGGVTAIRDVSLVVPDGSFTVLVGPSGCGKSTLLRMIAGLETITAGTCRIGDHVVNDIEPAERDIAMVFQNYALYPHMSVYDNMAYGLRNRGTPKDEIARRVSEAAKLLAIDEYLDRKPRALSGGQRQRVAMGRAIVREPQVFLFDEPLSNLDAKLRVTMRVEIRRLHNRLKATTVFVTHDQVEAMTLADQVVVMNGGRIEQVGHPGEVYRRPKSSFVATFFGSPGMNMLPGKVTEPGVVDVGGGRFTYDPKYFAGVTGSEVLLGVRPEDLVIAAGQEGVVFRREIVEELGASRVVHGTAGGKPLALAMPVTVAPPSPDEVRVTAPKSAIHLFDPQHGQSLRSVP